MGKACFYIGILLSLCHFDVGEAGFFGIERGRGDLDVRLYNRYPRPDPVRFRKLGAKDPAGMVVTARGESWRILPEGQSFPLNLRTSVFVPDRLRTSRHASLKVALIDNTVLAMAGDSELVIHEYIFNEQEHRSRISLSHGTLQFLVGGIAEYEPKEFKIEAAMATIGIRGSGGYIRLTPGAEPILEIATMEGHVLDVWTRWGDHLVLDQAQLGIRIDSFGNVQTIAIPPGYFVHEGYKLEPLVQVVKPESTLPNRQPLPEPQPLTPAEGWACSAVLPSERKKRRSIQALAQEQLLQEPCKKTKGSIHKMVRLDSNFKDEREKPSSRPLLQQLAEAQLKGRSEGVFRKTKLKKESASSQSILHRLGEQVQATSKKSLMGRVKSGDAE